MLIVLYLCMRQVFCVMWFGCDVEMPGACREALGVDALLWRNVTLYGKTGEGWVPMNGFSRSK